MTKKFSTDNVHDVRDKYQVWAGGGEVKQKVGDLGLIEGDSHPGLTQDWIDWGWLGLTQEGPIELHIALC